MKDLLFKDITIKYHESLQLVKDNERIVFLSKNLDEINCIVDFKIENNTVKSINIKPRFNIDITIENGVYIFNVNFVED
ncbi:MULTISPECIES: hypothetical protein [Macrococcoides]|uniref:Uncharacterized protein n=2 Tax=Staphylococcaceae TaxID=90964 RepID=A0A4R6C1J4_9STAP|nr:hypothetical protein [Macrococcus]QYA34096.1 hypothetical protein KYI10_11905 [Macrococcus sp. 19Msa1099]QYA38881.1 hypothetical protein KYI07_11790 [Macrococcus caseolyticus]QYA77604.1 hypothetical protein KYI12_11880 [Macrococcus caseolyticus]TDM15156.1 hypothetical protein ETI04_10630 [Macrococcus canis]TDM19648.1 hypothetical protein ETI05_10740 [Macrococcus canis]